MQKTKLKELINQLKAAGCVITTKIKPAKDDHHLWENNDGTWNMKFTVLYPKINDRIKSSLQTKSFTEACCNRDYLLASLPHRKKNEFLKLASGFHLRPEGQPPIPDSSFVGRAGQLKLFKLTGGLVGRGKREDLALQIFLKARRLNRSAQKPSGNLQSLQKPANFIMGASKGKDDGFWFNPKHQPQLQPNANLEVVLHQFSETQPGMLMRLAQHSMEPINRLANFGTDWLGVVPNNCPEPWAKKDLAVHGYARSRSMLPLYRRSRPCFLSAVNSASIRFTARFNSVFVTPYSCRA